MNISHITNLLYDHYAKICTDLEGHQLKQTTYIFIKTAIQGTMQFMVTIGDICEYHVICDERNNPIIPNIPKSLYTNCPTVHALFKIYPFNDYETIIMSPTIPEIQEKIKQNLHDR